VVFAEFRTKSKYFQAAPSPLTGLHFDLSSYIKSGQHDLVQELAVGFGIEVFGLVVVGKVTTGQSHRSQDFLRVPFAARGDLRLGMARGPSLMQRGTLPERGFVFENDYPAFGLGFFLDWDKYTAPIGSVPEGRPAPTSSSDAAPNNPDRGATFAHGRDGR